MRAPRIVVSLEMWNLKLTPHSSIALPAVVGLRHFFDLVRGYGAILWTLCWVSAVIVNNGIVSRNSALVEVIILSRKLQ